MGYNSYIGARYLPLIMGAWNANITYEPLSVVLYQHKSYTSKTTVPAGILPTNETYWGLSADYNAQVDDLTDEIKRTQKWYQQQEQQHVQQVQQQIDAFETTVNQGNRDFQIQQTQRQQNFENEQTNRQQNFETATNNTIAQYKQDIDESESQFSQVLNQKYNAQQTQINDLVLQAGNPDATSAEIAQARGGKATLDDRLNSMLNPFGAIPQDITLLENVRGCGWYYSPTGHQPYTDLPEQFNGVNTDTAYLKIILLNMPYPISGSADTGIMQIIFLTRNVSDANSSASAIASRYLSILSDGSVYSHGKWSTTPTAVVPSEALTDKNIWHLKAGFYKIDKTFENCPPNLNSGFCCVQPFGYGDTAIFFYSGQQIWWGFSTSQKWYRYGTYFIDSINTQTAYALSDFTTAGFYRILIVGAVTDLPDNTAEYLTISGATLYLINFKVFGNYTWQVLIGRNTTSVTNDIGPGPIWHRSIADTGEIGLWFQMNQDSINKYSQATNDIYKATYGKWIIDDVVINYPNFLKLMGITTIAMTVESYGSYESRLLSTMQANALMYRTPNSPEWYTIYTTFYLRVAHHMKLHAERFYVMGSSCLKPNTLSGKNIICFGDSITEGGAYSDLHNTWVEKLAAYSGCTAVNKGVSGSGFVFNNSQYPHILAAVQAAGDLSSYDYVFVAAGTNDCRWATAEQWNVDTLDAAIQNVTDEIFKTFTGKLIYILPIPCYNFAEAGDDQTFCYRYGRLAGCINGEMVRKDNVGIIRGCDLNIPVMNSSFEPSVLPDGIHPNDAGYRMYARFIMQQML